MKLRDVILDALKAAGFTAVAAKPWVTPRTVEENTIAVGVKSLEAVQGAVYRYLGLDEMERECYGMALTAKIGLSLLTPKRSGGQAGEEFADAVLDSLLLGIEGFPVGEVRWEQPVYDPVRDSFCSEVTVTARVLAKGVKTDTEIRLESLEIRPSYE